MSKKDYQAIAAMIYRLRQGFDKPTMRAANPQEVLSEVTDELSAILKSDNGRFDHDRFREACETGRCRGMRQVA